MKSLTLSGLDASKSLYKSYLPRIERLNKKNIQPGLAVILVGNNPASQVYVKSKSTRFHKMGLFSETFKYKENISEVQLLSKIEELNKNKKFHQRNISLCGKELFFCVSCYV